VKAILNPEGVLPGIAGPGVEQREDKAEDSNNASQGTPEKRKTRRKRREFGRAQMEKIEGKKESPLG
jgi:hypothetical protein